METNWTKDEFHMYLLIYCANADFVESKVEIDFIKEHVPNADFDKIHSEFNEDNDFQSVQKIQSCYQNHGYLDQESLVEEVKQLFLADGKMDILESNLLLGLKHILEEK